MSADERGLLEYWDAAEFRFPSAAVKFKHRVDTDLFDLAKARTRATSLAVSPDGARFAVTAKDHVLRVFSFATAKVVRKYDEGLHVFQDAQRAGTLPLDTMAFGRKVALEKELHGNATAPPSNCMFDQTGHFLLYPTLGGVKVLNLETNRLCRSLGQLEADRFVAVSLYQGIPKVSSQYKSASAKKAAMSDATPTADPTLFAASFKSNRFFCFSSRDPSGCGCLWAPVFQDAVCLLCVDGVCLCVACRCF